MRTTDLTFQTCRMLSQSGLVVRLLAAVVVKDRSSDHEGHKVEVCYMYAARIIMGRGTLVLGLGWRGGGQLAGDACGGSSSQGGGVVGADGAEKNEDESRNREEQETYPCNSRSRGGVLVSPS